MSEYARIRSEEPLVLEEGPSPLPLSYEGISGFHHLSEDEVRTFGWVPFVRDEEPEHDPETQELVTRLVLRQSKIHLVTEVAELPEAVLTARTDTLRSELLDRLAHLRWEREVAGFTWNGHTFHSDRESQVTLALAATQRKERLWKLKDGSWVLLSVEDLEQAVEALDEFKETLFEREAHLAAELGLATSKEALEAVAIASVGEGV